MCWTTLSTRKLAAELTTAGRRLGADTVARLLGEQGFSLHGKAKTIEGGQHLDRDAPRGVINSQATQQGASQSVGQDPSSDYQHVCPMVCVSDGS